MVCGAIFNDRNKWLDQLRNDSTRPTGGVLLTVDMVVQRRDGPRRLRDDDDDEDDDDFTALQGSSWFLIQKLFSAYPQVLLF